MRPPRRNVNIHDGMHACIAVAVHFRKQTYLGGGGGVGVGGGGGGGGLHTKHDAKPFDVLGVSGKTSNEEFMSMHINVTE